MRSRRQPVVTGADQLLREPAVALAAFDRSGPVRVRGEISSEKTSTIVFPLPLDLIKPLMDVRRE